MYILVLGYFSYFYYSIHCWETNIEEDSYGSTMEDRTTPPLDHNGNSTF